MSGAAYLRLSANFKKLPPTKLRRSKSVSPTGNTHIFFSLKSPSPTSVAPEVTNGGWRLGEHWKPVNTIMQKGFFAPGEPKAPWAVVLKARMRDLRFLGVPAKLAAELVLEQYYREG